VYVATFVKTELQYVHFNIIIQKLTVMKSLLRTVGVLAIVAGTVLFVTCSKEGHNPKHTPGTLTSMKIVISTPLSGNNMRNTTEDENGLIEESDVKSVDVFVYTASGALERRTHLTAEAFTQQVPSGSDNYDRWNMASTHNIPTTTGPKLIYVGVNLPTAVAESLEDITAASDMVVAAQIISREQMIGAGGFVMFCTQGVERTFVPENDPNAETANSVSVDVERLVAKVTVETSKTFDKSGLPGTLLDELEYTVTKFNTEVFMLQESSAYHKDPNWTAAQYSASATMFDNTVADFKAILNGADYTTITKTDYEPDYATENTSEMKTKKEVTRAVVRGTFIPSTVTYRDDDASPWQERPNTVTSETPAAERTFYAVTPSVASATRFFTDSEQAAAYAEENSTEEAAYTNGYCYWDIFLGKDPEVETNIWDVLRNDYYKCTITRIINLGRNNPEVPDPDVTPDNNTSIETTINVLYWHAALESNYEL
jgi:hypothetical protein